MGVPPSVWERWWDSYGVPEARALLTLYWDPIGVYGDPGFRGEYDSYAERLRAPLRAGAGLAAVRDVLVDVARSEMGLPQPGTRADLAAGKILEWYAYAMARLEARAGRLDVEPAAGGIPVIDIASEHAPGSWIRFSALRGRFGDPRLRVEARAADAVRCTTEVAMVWGSGEPDGRIDDWFQTLATDWRGWDGERRWRSLEGGLLIRARHRGNRVALGFRLQPDARPPEWVAEVEIALDPGEGVATVARQVRTLRPSFGQPR